MALAKVVGVLNGVRQFVRGLQTSAGVADADKLIATGADGRIDATLMPLGFGQNTQTAIASEVLAANDLVNIWNDAGVGKVRKADGATPGKEANGFVKAGFALNAVATYYTHGNAMTGLTGRTPGARQYLSATPGQLTETALETIGQIHQYIGDADESGIIIFTPDDYVLL